MKPQSVKYVDVGFYETSFCIIYPPTAINHKENWILRLEAAYTDKTSIREWHNILQTTHKVTEQAEQRNFPHQDMWQTYFALLSNTVSVDLYCANPDLYSTVVYSCLSPFYALSTSQAGQWEQSCGKFFLK